MLTGIFEILELIVTALFVVMQIPARWRCHAIAGVVVQHRGHELHVRRLVLNRIPYGVRLFRKRKVVSVMRKPRGIASPADVKSRGTYGTMPDHRARDRFPANVAKYIGPVLLDIPLNVFNGLVRTPTDFTSRQPATLHEPHSIVQTRCRHVDTQSVERGNVHQLISARNAYMDDRLEMFQEGFRGFAVWIPELTVSSKRCMETQHVWARRWISGRACGDVRARYNRRSPTTFDDLKRNPNAVDGERKGGSAGRK